MNNNGQRNVHTKIAIENRLYNMITCS